MNSEIPTEVYLAFLDRTIEIHWNYHAILMFGIWFVLVPVCIISLRFFKPVPTLYGIEKETSKMVPKWRWFTIHIVGLYLAIFLALGGMGVALIVSGGFSGTMHAMLGLGTIFLGCLQIVSSLLRGTHGGKYGIEADPNDPSTWRGDHFDMTPRRRKFEAYHKTAGFFTFFMAVGAAISGLTHFWMPGIAIGLGIVFVFVLTLSIVLEYRGYRKDTYRAVFGNHPDHPHNKAQKKL